MLYSQALLSREKTGYNLMVRGQDCRLDVTTVSILLLRWPLRCPTSCAAELRRRRPILQTLCCGRKPTKAWIQNYQCFNMVVGLHCCLSRQEDYKNITFVIPKDSYQVLFFLQLTAHCWISYSLGITYCSISSIEAGIHVQNDGPKFHPPY